MKLDEHIRQQKVTLTVTPAPEIHAVDSLHIAQAIERSGGEGGIRTHGPLRDNGFRDRPIRPLSHLSSGSDMRRKLNVMRRRFSNENRRCILCDYELKTMGPHSAWAGIQLRSDENTITFCDDPMVP